MDSFNKVISFVLGLVVVLVFFAVVTGKINLKGKTNTTAKITPTPTQTQQKNNGGFFGLFMPKNTPTPTPTQKPISVTTNNNGSATNVNNVYSQNNQVYKASNTKSIPATGLPTLFIPLLFSGMAGGSLLRKSGKK